MFQIVVKTEKKLGHPDKFNSQIYVFVFWKHFRFRKLNCSVERLFESLKMFSCLGLEHRKKTVHYKSPWNTWIWILYIKPKKRKVLELFDVHNHFFQNNRLDVLHQGHHQQQFLCRKSTFLESLGLTTWQLKQGSPMLKNLGRKVL